MEKQSEQKYKVPTLWRLYPSGESYTYIQASIWIDHRLISARKKNKENMGNKEGHVVGTLFYKAGKEDLINKTFKQSPKESDSASHVT